jgi:tetratricopeptide (TPR) repeat protein
MTTPSLPVDRTSRRGIRGSRRRASIALAIGLLTAIVFFPAIGNAFVSWDDPANFLENPHFRGLGRAQLSWAWRSHTLGVYQPLGWMLYSLQYVAWGLDPVGYHLVSVVLHAANAALFFLVAVELLAAARPDLPDVDRTFGAALAAVLFAIHPLRVEVVAWVSCQSYLPSVLFGLLSLLAYLRARAPANQAHGSRRASWIVCSLLYLTAVLCKAVVVTLPLLYVILDVYPFRRRVGPWARGAWSEKLPLFVIGAAAGTIAMASRWSEGTPEAGNHGPSARLAQASYSIVYYPLETLAPVDLTPFHRPPAQVSLFAPGFASLAAIVVGLSVVLVVLRRRLPGLLAAWAAYLVLLAPNSGIVWFGPLFVADRYSYVSTMMVFVLAAAGVASPRPWSRSPRVRIAAVGLGLVPICCLIPLTLRQERIWRHSQALWGHAEARFAREVRADPTSALAHYNLGHALLKLRRFDEAFAQFRTALKLDPGLAGDDPEVVDRLRAPDGP